jgi:hypothetical protein
MRTTVTLDPDVAASLEALVRERRLSLKAVLDTVLRRGPRTAPEGRTSPLGSGR